MAGLLHTSDAMPGLRRQRRGRGFVYLDARGRPVRVGEGRVSVEVLGAVMGLGVRERGFRVRTHDGTELTLVREPRERWYADEPV